MDIVGQEHIRTGGLSKSVLLPIEARSLSTLYTAHVRKHIRLSPPAQLQCSHSRTGEVGNEVNISCTVVTGKCGYSVWNTHTVDMRMECRHVGMKLGSHLWRAPEYWRPPQYWRPPLCQSRKSLPHWYHTGHSYITSSVWRVVWGLRQGKVMIQGQHSIPFISVYCNLPK